MNLAIQTNLLPGDSLEAKFDAAARYGFDGVEINVGPNFDLDRNLSAIRAAMTSSGLPVSGICTHPIHDPFHADPGGAPNPVRAPGSSRRAGRRTGRGRRRLGTSPATGLLFRRDASR